LSTLLYEFLRRFSRSGGKLILGEKNLRQKSCDIAPSILCYEYSHNTTISANIFIYKGIYILGESS